MTVASRSIRCLLPVLSAVLAGLPFAARAAIDLYDNGEQSLTFTGFLRTAVRANDGETLDARLENFELHLNAKMKPWLRLKYATAKDGRNIGNIDRLYEAYVAFEPSDAFNVWVGRHLLPSSRSNLSGVANLDTWNFPYAQAYPAPFFGRDNGVTVWGQFGGGRLRYKLGAYRGRTGEFNPDHKRLLAARIVLNFLDPESGYFLKTTYHGVKDILAVGLTFEHQEDAVGTAGNAGDFSGWNIDVMLEKKLPNQGVIGLEGAYYDYDLDNMIAQPLAQGSSFYGTASYMLPRPFGIGTLQPHIRYLQFDREFSGRQRSMDFGVNYVIKGHKLRATLAVRLDQPGRGQAWQDSLVLGLQASF